MQVKGTAFLARQSLMVARFGEAAWRRFFDAWRLDHPDFPADVISVTTLPVESFLALNDALVEHFHAGEATVMWQFGEASAEWALREGPYKAFFESRSIEGFLRTCPSLWKAYYSEGAFEATWDAPSRTVDARIEVPVEHLHFELNVMGFLHRALTLVGMHVTGYEAREGFSQGDARIHYVFTLADAAPAAVDDA